MEVRPEVVTEAHLEEVMEDPVARLVVGMEAAAVEEEEASLERGTSRPGIRLRLVSLSSRLRSPASVSSTFVPPPSRSLLVCAYPTYSTNVE